METSISYSDLINGENYYISTEDKYKKHSLNGPERETASKDQILSKILRYLASELEKRNMILLSWRKTAA